MRNMANTSYQKIGTLHLKLNKTNIMTKQYYKVLGNECFHHLKETNPNGGIKEFVRVAVEFGYKKAVKDLSLSVPSLPTSTTLELKIEVKKGEKMSKILLLKTLLGHLDELFKIIHNKDATFSEKMFGADTISIAKQNFSIKIIINK